MDSKLITLSLLLKELGVEFDINSRDARKNIQKAVCLAQSAGIDLGYRFNWYLMGPYSPSLAATYFELEEDKATVEADAAEWELSAEQVEAARKVAAALRRPAAVTLTADQWIELVASYDFLTRCSRYSEAKALDVIRSQKPSLAPWVAQARAALSRLHG